MRVRIAALAFLTAAAAACSSSSSGGAAPTTPRPTPTPTSTPTYTQLGTLAISHVVDSIRFTGDSCPATLPEVEIKADQVIACDARPRHVYVLDQPALDEHEVEATTVGQEPDGHGWTVYLQLSKRGARAFGDLLPPYAVVYNGVVVNRPSEPSAVPGGLLQIQGLSKHKAQRIAAALNPS
jgi:preprotein translocase subunit SecD